MIVKTAFLRARQLGRSLRASALNETESAYIRMVLNPAQRALFEALPLYEQRHAYNVCRTLVSGGYSSDMELLQAALLHDLGKHDPTTGRTIPIWVKVANVAATMTLGPRFVARLARPDPPNHWRYLFWLQTTHEERGAQLAQQAGSTPRVITLVGGQQPDDPAAKTLKWADDLN
jgi:hypothetical protein